LLDHSLTCDSGIIDVARTKIKRWLEEENLMPEETENPDAYYTFGISVYGMKLFVVHSRHFPDSVSVSANFDVTGKEEQQKFVCMGEKGRKNFIHDLSIALYSDNRIWYHIVRPNPPSEIKAFEIGSRRIYYETITKEKLMNAIFDVRNASLLFSVLSERHANTPSLKHESTASFIG
jgi:hypothetical protein